MKRNRILTNKYLLLAAVLIAMLALSGCRTRITNNSEVSNVKYDEDGFLSETYQMRRDELGLSIAERPLLPDFGSPEEDENSEPEIDENLNVVPEEDTYVEPPTTTEARNNANTNRTTTTTTTTRRTSRTDEDDNEEKVTIFFDANKGKIDGKEVLSVEVKKGSTYNTPPTPTREGYNGIIGWYTEEEEGKGNKVTFPYKVEDDVFLYAHWGDVSVTFNAAGGRINGKDTEVISLKKGSPLKYPKYEPKLENNEFKGWFTASNSGTVVKEGTVINESITLYAHWEGTNNEVTITFHGNGGTIGGETMVTHTVKPGEKVPVPAKDALSHPEGKVFTGWDPAIGNETEVVADTTKTYNAQWKKGKDYWNDKVTEEVEKGTEVTFQMVGGEDSAVVQSCGAKVDTENPAFLIKIITTTDTNPWPAPDDASAWDTAYAGMDTTKNRILISKATYDSKDDKQALFKLLLLNALHGGATPIIDDEQLNAAAADLGVNIEDIQINMRAGVAE